MAATAMDVDTPETKKIAPITGIIYPPPDIRSMNIIYLHTYIYI